MSTITEVCVELKSVLSALPAVDQSSLDNYTPMATTQKVALLIVPFQQSGVMHFGRLGPHVRVHAHEIPCEFWVKVHNADVGQAMEYGRDICVQAMLLLAVNYTLNGTVQHLGSTYNGTSGQIGRYTIAPRYEERGTVTWIIATLFVPVEIEDVI
jgi:hypothetical protein